MGSKEGQPLPAPPEPRGTSLSRAWWGLKEIASEEPRGAAGERAFVFHLQLSLGNVIHAQVLAGHGG